MVTFGALASGIAYDVQSTIRSMVRFRKRVTTTVLVILALGIAGCALTWSLRERLVESLTAGIREPSTVLRLRAVSYTRPASGATTFPFRLLRDLEHASGVPLVSYATIRVPLGGVGQTVTSIAAVEDRYFEALGLRASVGRLIGENDLDTRVA